MRVSGTTTIPLSLLILPGGGRSEDRLKLAREIRLAIAHFEPRLQLAEVDVQPLDGSRHALRVRIAGQLRSGGSEIWPVAFVMDMADGVVHERFD